MDTNTASNQLHALRALVTSKGWAEILLPRIEKRQNEITDLLIDIDLSAEKTLALRLEYKAWDQVKSMPERIIGYAEGVLKDAGKGL